MIFPNIKSFPTNWENGMKLTSEHFQHLEDSIDDSVRDVRSSALLASSSFGLLPFSPFVVQNAQGESPQSVRVILNACRAILPGGHRVEIIPENVQNLQVPLQVPFVEFVPTPNTRYHLYLSVNENKKVPAGQAQIRPVRHPFLTHDYQLECITNDKANAIKNSTSHRMKIAEWQDGKVDDRYIPALMTINGYQLMDKWYQFLQNQLENIVRIGIHVTNEHRKKDTPRAEFCSPIVSHIRSSQGYFKWLLPNQAPIHLAVYFGDLAGLVEGLIETCDRDFVRNQLKNGQINDLRTSIHDVLMPRTFPEEDMAKVIMTIKRFTDSLISTLQTLVTSKPPAPRMGDRNIASG